MTGKLSSQRILIASIAAVIAAATAALETTYFFPDWSNKYQTLLAGVIAFLAATAAVIAAAIGARAIIRQAEINADALATQSASQAANARELDALQHRRDVSSLALALAAELDNIARSADTNSDILTQAIAGKLRIFMHNLAAFALPTPFVAESLLSRIGHLPAPITAKLVDILHRLHAHNGRVLDKPLQPNSDPPRDLMETYAQFLKALSTSAADTARQLRAYASTLA